MILNLPVASQTALSKKVLGAYDFASIGRQASYAFAALHTKRNASNCFPAFMGRAGEAENAPKGAF
jgi:hypothetical protein